MTRHVFASAGVAVGVGTAYDAGTHAKDPRASYHNGRMNKPARERRAGQSLTADDGVVRFRRQLFDREGNWYEEDVFNPDGSVMHSAAHPLNEHRDRGSAKPRRARIAD